MKTQELEHDEARTRVREQYGKVATNDVGCGCAPTCCGTSPKVAGPGRGADAVSQELGYTSEQMGAVPTGANLGLGCGNPQAIAALQRGETMEVPESLVAEEEPKTSETEELRAAFLRMIYSLPEPYREALVLTEFEGLTQQQLASRLGISLSGAKSRVQRGRRQLKEMLTQCCTFEFDRRGKVIDCAPRRKTECAECG